MEVTPISFQEFKKIYDNTRRDGLVFLGAGGDLQDWIKGVPEYLLKEGIAISEKFEDSFQDAYVMTSSGGRIDLAFRFKQEYTLNLSKLALWRVRFGHCSWISDFFINYREHYK